MRLFSSGIRFDQSKWSLPGPKKSWSQPAGHRGHDLVRRRSSTSAMTAIPTAAMTFSTNWIRSFITTPYMPPTTQ